MYQSYLYIRAFLEVVLACSRAPVGALHRTSSEVKSKTARLYK